MLLCAFNLLFCAIRACVLPLLRACNWFPQYVQYVQRFRLRASRLRRDKTSWMLRVPDLCLIHLIAVDLLWYVQYVQRYELDAPCA